MNMNFITQMLLKKLQGVNPNGYQFANTAMQNGGDGNAILNQILKNMSAEQRNSLAQQAGRYGVPDNLLKQIQNMK